MKKTRYIFIICFISFILSACFNGEKSVVKESMVNKATVDIDIPQESAGYFFPAGTDSCAYQAKSSIEPLADVEQMTLIITEVRRFDEGVLYELKCDSDENIVDRNGIPVLYLGLFYVQDNNIYFLRDEAVKDELTTVDAIIKTGTLVCCEEGYADVLGEDERGWHEYIETDGNTRIYHGYNSLVETGYYESFSWEFGKGLLEYRRGYGAEADALELFFKM